MSISITLNDAILYAGSGIGKFYGINYGAGTCRLNSAAGPVTSCSTPNTASVTYYGAAYDGPVNTSVRNCVFKVSWRDDRNLPHYADTTTHPGLKDCWPL